MDAGDEDSDEGDDSKNGYAILLAELSVEFVFVCLSSCWLVMRPSSKIANMLRQYIFMIALKLRHELLKLDELRSNIKDSIVIFNCFSKFSLRM